MFLNSKAYSFKPERALKVFKTLIYDPIKELIVGVRTKHLPFHSCGIATVLLLVIHIIGLDYEITKLAKVEWLYPTGKLWIPYKLLLMTVSFYAWGWWQVKLRFDLTRKLTETFTDAGLKSLTGRLPAFVSDEPLDEDSRRLRLRLQGQSFNDFKNAKDHLASALKVHIDEIAENRKSGTVDILYSYSELTDSLPYASVPVLGKDEFVIGQSRSKVIKASFEKVPHLLVAGQTNGGKSTFLRQFITSLYLNPAHKNYTFELIDLKEGLEFQTFLGLERVNVIENIPAAIKMLQHHASKTIAERAELFRHNKCKDIESFLKIPLKDRKYPKKISNKIDLGRKVIVIDEASEIFMAGAYANAQDIAKAKSSAAKIGSQGRALGVHLVISTQKPSVKAVDGQIKTHLTSRVCFKMSDIPSSVTILDSKRGAELSSIRGRAIWRCDSDLVEVQAPNLEEDKARDLLKDQYKELKNYDSDNEDLEEAIKA